MTDLTHEVVMERFWSRTRRCGVEGCTWDDDECGLVRLGILRLRDEADPLDLDHPLRARCGAIAFTEEMVDEFGYDAVIAYGSDGAAPKEA